MEMSKFVLFRIGHQNPNIDLAQLRLIKRSFVELKIKLRNEIRRIEYEADTDFEDKVDLQRDRYMLFLGACSLMQEVERQAGLQKGEFFTSQDLEIYTQFSAQKMMGAEKAVANG